MFFIHLCGSDQFYWAERSVAELQLQVITGATHLIKRGGLFFGTPGEGSGPSESGFGDDSRNEIWLLKHERLFSGAGCSLSTVGTVLWVVKSYLCTELVHACRHLESYSAERVIGTCVFSSTSYIESALPRPRLSAATRKLKHRLYCAHSHVVNNSCMCHNVSLCVCSVLKAAHL